MSSLSATINQVLTFSTVDGPGNRLVVFFQGCNLACHNCHNPYTIGTCNHCGDCIASCPSDALSLSTQGKIQWSAKDCTQCDTCLDVCPISASPKTQELSVSALSQIVRDNLPFISGITLSGGEATRQLPFIHAFLSDLRAAPDTQNLSCLLDTNGMLGQVAWQRLSPLIDGVMLDIKAWDSDCHKRITGRSNDKVKSTLQYVAQEGKLAELRFLVIPEVTDFDPLPTALIAVLQGLPKDTPIRINGFQHHGVKGIARQWRTATAGDIGKLAAQMQDVGLHNIRTPAFFD